jgi:hypothetical protein
VEDLFQGLHRLALDWGKKISPAGSKVPAGYRPRV